MKMKLVEFLQKVSQEGYKPAKILFEDVVFEPISINERYNPENEEDEETETEVQYTSAYPVSDGINDDSSYQTLIEWLLFGYWDSACYEDLLDFGKLEVTILEE